LYESGKVCLSLLKTWAGTGNEVWNPESSTVLQLLLSLQALVLNEKPYFNEAGYDKFVGKADGEKNSITYNENAFLLSCKSMMYVLQKPPKVWYQLLYRLISANFFVMVYICSGLLDYCITPF
jgi:ubiquitin-conjugating enzyme E2 O